MKISDSLGNLYTHTMFKKKTYEMKDDADEITVQVPSVPSKQKHHHHHRSNQRLTVEEDEESEDESVTSERSEDSISTKSSHHAMSRRQSERRREAASRSRSGVRIALFFVIVQISLKNSGDYWLFRIKM